MEFFVTFLEGIMTFISPCLLPMLPVYIAYFAGDADTQGRAKRTLVNALGFICGFSLVFIALGVFASALGGLLVRFRTGINIVGGIIIIFFGVCFTGLVPVGFLSNTYKPGGRVRIRGFFSALAFGLVFSVGWTPCVGPMVGAAVMTAAASGQALRGGLLLLCYCIGLGVPFLISALLIEQLKGAFDFIKKHYRAVNIICGCILIVLGILMTTGLLSRILGALAP